MTTTPCWGSRLVGLRARVVLAERVGALSPSVSARPGRPGGMACRGWPSGCMLGNGARGSASFDPQHAGAPSVTSYAYGLLHWLHKILLQSNNILQLQLLEHFKLITMNNYDYLSRCS